MRPDAGYDSTVTRTLLTDPRCEWRIRPQGVVIPIDHTCRRRLDMPWPPSTSPSRRRGRSHRKPPCRGEAPGTVGEADSSRPAASATTYHVEPGSSDMTAPTRWGVTGELRTDR
ncbi:hypothetical protein SCA03_17590 [Streptomyces cacaoi]|uniref:Uncharacterized protein n=1 Tax=Streptomyces cacaoi TaxID=1898 RepID=A0A4Y3QXP4_STRCI|nr:hypothetical protein SCA03_17590 [Streptomyces cacaoi]